MSLNASLTSFFFFSSQTLLNNYSLHRTHFQVLPSALLLRILFCLYWRPYVSMVPSAINLCICLLWQAVTGEMRSIIHEKHMHSICKQCLPSHYISVLLLNVTEQSLSHGTVLLGLRLHRGLATSQIHTYISIYTPLFVIQQDFWTIFSSRIGILESGGFKY